MSEALGAEFVRLVAGERIDVLVVRGPRSAHVALGLPFEVLLQAACTVVREVEGPRVADTRGAARGLLAAFALCPSAPYLPLHLEAADLRCRAHRARQQLDELFVTFTASQLLHSGRDRALVHIAGHGRPGGLLCMDDEHGARWLTSDDLVQAWRDAPPALVVLNTCEGSSDRDHASMLGPFMPSSLEARRRLASLLEVPTSASSSMALDLAGALPTSVIAMRTPVRDASARAFASAFYAAYLEEAAPLIEAFTGALRASDAFDHSGLPIPMLFVGALPATPIAEPSSEHSVLSDRMRRIAGYEFHAAAPLSQALDRSWLAWLNGLDPMVRDELVELIRFQAARRGIADGQVTVVDGEPGQTLVFADREGNGPRFLTAFEVDKIRSDVALAEVQAIAPWLHPHDVRLIASATCQVPHLLEGLRDVDLEVLAEELRQIAGERKPIRDRELPWELACALLARVPEEARVTVTEWAERRWSLLATSGDFAADVAASHYLLGDGEHTAADTYRMLAALAAATGAPADEVVATLTRLTESGVAGVIATDPDRDPEVLVIDGLTAARAWASCSAAGARAYVRAYLDKAFQVLAVHERAELLDDDLLELGGMCVAAKDARVWLLVGELRSRGDDERTAALAGEAVSAGLTPADGVTLQTGLLLTDDPGELDEVRERLLTDGDELQRRVHAAVLDAAAGSLAAEDVIACVVPLSQEVHAALVADEFPSAEAVRLLDMLMRAETNAHQSLGDAAAALASSERHLHTLYQLGAPIPLIARTSALTAGAFLREQRPDRARPILDAALARISLGAPTAAFILLQSVHVTALAIENRTGQLPGEADVLVNMLMGWDEPQRAVASRALLALAKAWVATGRRDLAVASLALVDLTGRSDDDFAARFAAEVLGLAGLRPSDVRGTVIATGRDLRGVLGRLGLTPDHVEAHLETWLEAVEAVHVDALEFQFGPGSAARLRARASAGCRATKAVISSVEGLDTRGGALPHDWSPDELVPHNARFGPLSVLLGWRLGQTTVAGLPIVARAYRGDREARVVWAAAVAEDLREDAHAHANGMSALCLRLGRGDGWPEIAPDLARVNPVMTAHALALVEHCFEVVELDAAWEASTRDFETVTMAAWPQLVRNASHADNEAALLLRLLKLALDRIEVIVAACQGRLIAGDHAAALSRVLHANVKARARLATVLAGAGRPDESLQVLAPETLPAGAVAALEAAVRRGEVLQAADRLDEARVELATLRSIAEQITPTADATSPLIGASMLALELGDSRSVSELGLAVLHMPWPDIDHGQYLIEVVGPCATNVLAALMALGDPSLAAQVRDLGKAYGFTLVCWAVGRNADALDEGQAAEIAEVLLTLNREPGRDLLGSLLEPMTAELLGSIAGRDVWAGVAEAVRRRLRAAKATS